MPQSAPAPIGILGGTFDPIHFGHLRLAEEAAEACGLAEVRLVPAGTPPHRSEPRAAAGQRLEMVRIAASGNPRLRVDERELRRSAPSYTVDTLIELRGEFGQAQPLCLLLGADAFAQLAGWSRWQRLFDLAHVVVARRPGYAPASQRAKLPDPLRKEFDTRLESSVEILHRQPAGAVCEIAITALDISASAIRAHIAAGTSARYLLPAEVLDYIRRNRLYI